jgi:TolB protein
MFSFKRFLVPLLCVLFFPTFTEAQEQIHIYVGAPGRSRVPIALPQPNSDLPAATEFYRVVKQDLELSGWVDIVDPNTYLEKNGSGVKEGSFRFENWDAVDAVALAKSSLQVKEGNLRSEIWVYDIAKRQKLGAKAFSASPANVRTLGHKVANEIIKQLTGKDAPFNTRFSVVNNRTGNKEIYVMDFDGQNMQRITRNGKVNLQPQWSPDDGKLAFTSYMNGNPDLYVANLTSGRITRLSARDGVNIGASWHPSGKELVATLSPNGNSDIYRLEADTGRILSRLTRDRGIDVAASYSPDGKKIAFVSERSGGAQIYIMNADGSGAKRVSFAGKYNTDPVFSPDGTRLAYVSKTNNFDIYTVKLDGTGLKRITQDQGDNEDPTWSPDGNYLAFRSTRTGQAHIWLSTADGDHQVRLTEGKGEFSNPDWSSPNAW